MALYDESTLDTLRERMPEYLEAVCGITNLRRPFRCLTPSHEDSHPSMSFNSKTNYVKCFSCGAGGDVFEVAGWVEGANSFPEKVQAVAQAVGYPLQTNHIVRAKRPVRASQRLTYDRPRQLDNVDLTNKMQLAKQMLLEKPQGKPALDYLYGRGFDCNIIMNSCIGWVKHPSVFFPDMKAPPSNDGYIALGFSTFNDSTAESTKPLACFHYATVPYAVFRMPKSDAQPKELKPTGMVAPIWQEYLLDSANITNQSVHVTEGIFDAMALMVLFDIKACAICGASGTTRLLQIMAHTPKDNRPSLTLSFDSDTAGIQITEKISKGLKELGIPHSVAKPYPYNCKDANELLMLERDCHE